MSDSPPCVRACIELTDRPQFRPPYGNYNDQVLSILAQRGYKKVFLWSDDTEDADGASVSYSENILDGVANDYPNPHLVLSHSTIETSELQLLALRK